MSSSSDSSSEKTELIFVENEYVSSEEVPMEEWSSLIIEGPEDNKKKNLHELGLYHPGSGEICTKYIALSDSSIFRHVYYNYPAVHDPGIKKALLQPEAPIIYSDDGQEFYLAVCKEMGLAPVKKFARGLLEPEIDLRYYCVDPRGVRPMAMALKYNKTVKALNLKDIFLSDDACFHLGEFLVINSTLVELNLSGCRIQSSGAHRLLHGLLLNRSLKTLNLNRNQLSDEGAEEIAHAVLQGLDIQNLYLSYNDIGGKGATALAEAFEIRNRICVLDLSWNSLVTAGPTSHLLTVLGESLSLQEIDLAWNSLTGPRIGTAIKALMLTPNLRTLNLSNNRLGSDTVEPILANLGKAKKLVTLDVSFNPLTPADALLILNKMKRNVVKVQNIFMENIFVNDAFLELLERIKALKFRKNFVVTYGGVRPRFNGTGPDMRELVLNRAEYLTKKSKKHAVDLALVVLQMVKNNRTVMNLKDFGEEIGRAGVNIGDDLTEQFCNAFPGPKSKKSKTINLLLMVEYMQRKWPERKLPPTPPPEPEPEPVVEVIQPKKGKGKGKGKK